MTDTTQPSPDLAQIQRLIEAASENPFHVDKAINLSLQTQRAITALRSLLAEVEQQGAVIAAMRDKFVKIVTDGHPECGCYYHAAQASADLNTAQLAADHDAAVRADERRKVLEEAAQLAQKGANRWPGPIVNGSEYEQMACYAGAERMACNIAQELRKLALAAQPEEAGE